MVWSLGPKPKGFTRVQGARTYCFAGSLWASVNSVLGGSWVVISGVRSPLVWVITIVTRLITLLITTHEPPSRV